MQEAYITLEEVAIFEGVAYDTMQKRARRNKTALSTKAQTREGGGKEQVMIAVSSLSPKAKKAYKAAQKVEAADIIIEKRTDAMPWYVEADLNQYIESHKRQYYEAVELAKNLQEYISYQGADRTDHAKRIAISMGVSAPTLYRYVSSVLEANAWALRLEKEDGQNREYFRALSLCRKPQEIGRFPSLTDEQKAVIENIWFDSDFANNQCTVEMLYEYFVKESEKREWSSYPSLKTVHRYIKHLMDERGAESARYLAANGLREWKNKKQLKCKRDASTLDVMEYVVADAHTFDLWVQYTSGNGKIKAIKPTIVAWMDMRTRCILGPVACEHSNAQVVKESVVRMLYSDAGGSPKHAHMDNGKDFTAAENLGQERKDRSMNVLVMDAETKGFLRSIGIERWSRSLPFQPWDKPIERAFKTFCMRHSKKYASYVGTLTASSTDAKRKKDIGKMLKCGELLTLEEFYELFCKYLEEDYHVREHDGLKDAGEKWTKPKELFENGPRYEKAAPPREYAAMLLMKSARARVNSQGITKFKTLYTHYELAFYNEQTVKIRWDIDDVTKLYVYDKNGKKICEAVSAELLEFGDRVSQTALDELHRKKNRQLAETRAMLKELTTPYEQRMAEKSESSIVGKIDLTIKAKREREQKVITLPTDKEYRSEKASSREKKNSAGDEYLMKQAEIAYARMAAINE